MDKNLALSKIYPDAEYNPACFDYSEEEARSKNLWRDARPMPTQAEMEAAYANCLDIIEKDRVKSIFSGIRKLWQSMSDDFAADNALKGITQEGKTKEIADKFSQVIYYLNCNAPLEAIKELDLIVTDNKYITQAVINNMKNKLIAYINE